MTNSTPTYRILDLAESERPRERLAKLGPNALSAPELLAILLRTGVPGENAVQVGQRLLNKFGGIFGLHRASFEDVCAEHGIGPAKAAQIKAALELGHRMKQEHPDEQTTIHSPGDAAELVLYEMSVLEQEEMGVILLDTRNRVVGREKIYRGSVNTAQVKIGELFRKAIRQNAPSLIVVHNHPSGVPRSM